MPTTYTPTPVELGAITLPSDADGPHIKAADVDVPLEALADGVAFVHPRMDEFLVDGTWTCPVGVTSVRCRAYGAGAGGGCGADGDTTGAHEASGGGAGGSALESEVIIPVTPGLVYAVGVGVGGAGSPSGTTNARGADGGDTTFTSPTPTVLATWRGAQGGTCGIPLIASASTNARALGGSPSRIDATDPQLGACVNGVAVQIANRYAPQTGGDGITVNLCINDGGTLKGYAGGSSANFPGGNSGTGGTTASTRHGGGPGGGGGAGPGGPGGAGGNGGNGNATTASASTAGTAAADNTGAGGGGGGAGAGAGTTPSVGSAGAVGGSGRFRIYYPGGQAVVT